MDEATKQKRKEALEAVLAILPGLKYYEWAMIKHHVDHFYNARTTNVELDGPDIELIRRNFTRDHLGSYLS